jgi:hypothetical protein
MRRLVLLGFTVFAPLAVQAQAATDRAGPDGVVTQFVRFANIFGHRLVLAFDSIPAERYGYKPMPVQQSIGYIAQHLEDANYSLCERFGNLKHARTAKDSLADTVKAQWPKDTLVARLKTSLRFCDDAMERLTRVDSPALAANLLAFETDLAEHYSQLAVYMRLLGMVPPSALPPKKRTVIEVPASALSPYAGTYEITPGVLLEISVRDGGLYARSNLGGGAARLWPESRTNFFSDEAEAQIDFVRDAGGTVTGLVLHQFGRDRRVKKIR